MEEKTLRLAFGGCTSAGIKPLNEDAFAAIHPTDSVRKSKGAIVCIADGVSCSENAQQASETSVTTFIQDYLSTPETWDVKTSAGRVLSSLNSWLFHQGQSTFARHNGLVTTFSSIIFKSTSAHILHSGDSRVYRCRKNELIQLSRDHCLVEQTGKARLTRALGMDSQLKVDYQQKATRVGDVFMLSTDGVHDTLRHIELTKYLDPLTSDESGVDAEGFNLKLEKIAEQIVGDAKAAGSMDNISCLLVKVLSLPIENIDEVHRELTRLVIPPALEVGSILDGYKITRVIYNGVRSYIYLAEHPRFREPFVLKVPSQRFDEDAEYLEGFVREQWVGRRVNNPGVMKIYEPVADSKFLYHICEYVPGQTLRQWILDNPLPSLSVVREIARQIISCVRVFQRMGMVHRDLKPENIMITDSGQIQLIDFGTVQIKGWQDVSSPLSEENPAGTAEYIAPECLMGERGEHRSDIFSVGVIVYEMLSGKLPYKAPAIRSNQVESFDAWHYQPITTQRNDLPLWLDLALKKACSPRPSRRYDALSEFLQDIEKPNRALLAQHQSAPLLEKSPLLVWKMISGILAIIIILQWVLPAI